MRGVTCPCGNFPAGDPSDEHSAQHAAWLGHRFDDLDQEDRRILGEGFEGESTSARLRRVEQELDDWKAAAKSWSDRYAEACRAGHVLQAELASARAELQRMRAELARAKTEGEPSQ
jgi:chromosome segregation ATPase